MDDLIYDFTNMAVDLNLFGHDVEILMGAYVFHNKIGYVLIHYEGYDDCF